MRIAYLINSLDGYGAGLPVPMITGFMRAAGADVRLFAFARRDGRMESILQNANLPYDVRLETGLLSSFGWLHEKLEAYRPTLIWTSLAHATLIGRVMGARMRLPVVSWQHNVFLKPGNIAALWLTKGLTDLWVADSDSVAAITKTRFGLRDEDVEIWPLFATDPAAPRANAAAPGEIFRLGSLGRLNDHKGYDVLIDALAQIQREDPALSATFTVNIGGDGPARGDLEARMRAQSVTNLFLAGFQPDPKRFLATLHGYVQPSRVEGLCISAHEAMQAGLATIVSDVGEMPLTVRHGDTGFIAPAQNVDALAQAIKALVSNPAHAASMGVAAHARVNEKFSRARFDAAGHAILRAAAQLRR